MSVKNVEITLKKLHPGQQSIIDTAKRFNHLRCGRRFGKTTLIEDLCSVALDGWPVGVWFPTYKDLSEVWKDVKRTYAPVTARVNEQLKQIELITFREWNNSKLFGLIDFWSMEDPDSGQGRRYKRAILDEAAKAKKVYEAWENTIRPTLTDFTGDAYIMSRPKGKNNGFYKIEEKHKKFPNWNFSKYTTYDNPYMDKKEVEEAKAQLDVLTFLQEFMAEYVDANDRPYLYAFDEELHTIKDYKLNTHLDLLISFDFNKEPMTALISQQPRVNTLVIFDEIRINAGSTPEVCDVILAKYPKYIGKMEVTGDATGRNRTAMVRGNINHYTIIKERLRLNDRQLIVPNQNPSHLNSRVLCNSVVQNAIFYITKNCKETIMDCTRANVDENGDLVKTEQEGRHFFDNVRYLIEAAFKDFISKPHKYDN